MLNPFYGELLLHPSPLEISGNKCSHNCCYCFSNIRCESRSADIPAFVNALKKSHQRKTFTHNLIQDGYSICVSNRTDPFSKTNVLETRTIFKYLSQMQNGVFVQTKGGENFYEIVDMLNAAGKKNVLFYFTITSKKDEVSKRIEPGAPIYQERLKQADIARKNGFEVIFAFNPICEEWMSREDHEQIHSDAKNSGVEHFIYQRLHMSSNDIKRFSQDRLSRFDDGILQKALVRKKNEGQAYLQELIVGKINEGKKVLAFGMPYRTDFFTDVRKCLGKCFPSMYDFVNYAHDSEKNIFDFDDFKNALGINNEEIFNETYNGLSAYILRVARNVWKGNDEAQSVKNMIDVLKVYWKEKRISGSPQNNFLFQRIENDENEVKLYFDKNIHKLERTKKL